MTAEKKPVRQCGNCFFFQRDAKVIGLGLCWCLPPQAVPTVGPGGQVGIVGARAPVPMNEICGQWRPCKPTAENSSNAETKENTSSP